MRSHRLQQTYCKLRTACRLDASCFINLQQVCKYQVAASVMFTDLIQVPDWNVCIAQPANFGPSARPDAQILEIFFSGAQFTKAHMQNAIPQFLKRVERAEIERRPQKRKAKPLKHDTRNARIMCCVSYGWLDQTNLRV